MCKTAAILIFCIMLFPIVQAAFAQTEKPNASTRKMHEFPKVGKYRVLMGDLHMHTTFSDGYLTPEERMMESWKAGYDVVAVTGHGNHLAYRDALPVARSLGLELIRGLETSLGGKEHLVILGVSDKYVPAKPNSWSETPEENKPYYRDELKKLHMDGSLVIYAHPHVGFREPIQWGVENRLIYGLEVKNEVVGSGWNTVYSHGTWCYPEAFDWAMAHNIGVFANTDAHMDRGANPPVTLIFAKDRSKSGIMNAIRDGRTVAWFDGVLWGSEKLLSDLIGSVIQIRSVNPGGQIVIKNRSPLILKAKILYTGAGMDIGPYEEVITDYKELSESIGIEWANVWTGRRTTLKTVSPIK